MQRAGRIQLFIELALLYGSVVKGKDTATSDIDLLIVADGVTLEEIYSALAPAEADLVRKINPTLYTSQEFVVRKAASNTFLSRVLSGEHLVLMGMNMSQRQLDNLVSIGKLMDFLKQDHLYN